MAGLTRRLAPAAALGGLAVIIVGVADPALAGHGSASAGSPALATAGTTATAPTTAPDTAANGQAVTGPLVQTRWGPVQVAATVVDGQLTDVHAIVWPDGDGRSAMISQYAIPQLDAQASAQGVQFDGVSGATYTTEGYRQSLQGLLDSM